MSSDRESTDLASAARLARDTERTYAEWTYDLPTDFEHGYDPFEDFEYEDPDDEWQPDDLFGDAVDDQGGLSEFSPLYFLP